MVWAFIDLAVLFAKAPGMATAFGLCLFAFAKMLLGAIILAPTLANWISIPIFAWVDSIYRPGGYNRKPPLCYRLGEQYIREKKYDLALVEYRDITRYYPKEIRAAATLYLLYKQTDETRRAERWYARSIFRYSKPRFDKAISKSVETFSLEVPSSSSAG